MWKAFTAGKSAFHHAIPGRASPQYSLSSGSSLIRTDYVSRAPDEMRSRSTGGFQTVWLGRTEYLQRQPGAGWIVESGPSDELFGSDNEFVAQFLNAETEGPLAMD